MTEPTSMWQPTITPERLRQRGAVLARIRRFFDARGVVEVETPVMSHCAVSDPFIDSIEVRYADYPGADPQLLYLQTSPEYAMKRLLAAGSGPIYQMGKVFRNGESGSRHNPEFTMLEWYRPGFDDSELMDEVDALVSYVLGLPAGAIERVTYADLFDEYLSVNPFTASLAELQAITRRHIDLALEDEDRDAWLNLLMSHVIEPLLETRGPVFVYDFPASQAALAQVRQDQQGRAVAARFELFIRGMELANGYHELTDADEQRQRLLKDQATRQTLGLPDRPLEMRLVDALEAGMPDSAGVALGVDRLVMLACGADRLAEVVSFPFERA